MPGLGIQDYPAAPPPKKKNWIKIAITAFMVLIVLALAAAVASNTMNWLFVRPGH
jgi:flagellar basal body-associated protein FliL